MTQIMKITMEEKSTAAADRKRTESVATGERTKVKKRSTLETFMRFGTDASGLERTFRLLQAVAQCIQHLPTIRSIAVFIIFFIPRFTYAFFFSGTPGPVPDWKFPWHEADRAMEHDSIKLRAQMARGRRLFRVFRFLESFHSAFGLYQATNGDKDLVTWLDISAKSFNGMYLLFETLMFFPSQGVSRIAPWGKATGDFLNVEGQRFWFFALVCGALAGVVRLWNDYRDQVEDGSDTIEEEKEPVDAEGDDEHGKQLKEEECRRAVLEGKKERAAVRKDRRMRILRRIVADLLDIPQPGAVVGWTPGWHGMIGVMMIGSTLLTGMEVWEKCSQL